MDTVSSFNRIIFDQISKSSVTNYLLDYVTKEYESIISCPSVNYQQFDHYINNKRQRTNSNEYCYTSNKFTRTQINTATGLPSPPLSSPESKLRKYNQIPVTINRPPSPPPMNRAIPLRSYIESVVQNSRIDTGTLLTSLAYARRLRSKLFNTSKGMECTHHRIFIATLMIASKYIHDSALKNKYWVGYAQMFSPSEINLMEKQLLQLLDYNLEIKPDEYNSIVDDIVQLYFMNNYSKEEVQDVSTCSFQMNYNTKSEQTLLNRLKSTASILSSL